MGGTGVGVVTGVCRCWCPPSIGQIPPRVSPALHSLQRTGTAWGFGTPLRISLVCRLRLVAVAEVGSRSTAPPPSSYQEAEREGEGEGDDTKEKIGEQIWRKSTWICYRRWRRRRWSLERRRGDDGRELAAAVLVRWDGSTGTNPPQPNVFVNPTQPDP